MSNARWVTAGALAELAPGQIRTFKSAGSNLALIRSDDGAVHALENRCPHEGYPLTQGDLKDCVLTCAWHNWKFDVRDGACLLGGEAVRSYPTRIVDGTVEVDLAEPDPAEQVPRLRASLEEALHRGDRGRALRDAARLLLAGYPGRRILGDVARFDALHAEYGMSHTLPTAADAARLLERYPGVDALYPAALAVDICVENDVRQPRRPVPPARPGGTLVALRAAVEDQDLELAQALLLGAFDASVPEETIDSWMFTVISAHFTEFGHDLIYLIKAQELLSGLDASYRRDIYLGLLYSVLVGTREDTLPYLRPWFQRLEEVAAELPALYGQAGDAPLDHETLRDAVLDGTLDEAFGALWSALGDGVDPAAIAGSLVAAGAHRLYRFDLEVERDPDVQEGWLFATHRLTFASAARNAIARFPSPDALRFLFQAAAFIHTGRRMDAPVERRYDPAGPDAVIVPVAELVESVRSRRTADAVSQCAAYLSHGLDAAPLRDALLDHCLQDPLVRPIFACHALKTTGAAFEERAALADHPDRDWPVLAAVRFLASPVLERRLHQTTRDTIRWVAEGKTPRKLTQ